MSARNFEADGHDAVSDMLNELLTCNTQAKAAPAIASCLERIAEYRGKQSRKSVAGGASVALVDVLMLGMAAVKARSHATPLETRDNDRAELVAKIRAAGDGIEAADVLTDWLMKRFGKCSTEAAHKMAVDLLPLVRADLFAMNGEVA